MQGTSTLQHKDSSSTITLSECDDEASIFGNKYGKLGQKDSSSTLTASECEDITHF